MIDSHCHLNFKNLINDFSNIINRARKNGITAILSINTKLDEFDSHYQLIKRYQSLFISCGLHPGNVNSNNIPIAGIYLVWDVHTVYAILRASDPTLRNNGANSLIAWKAIEFALENGKNFDFAGSWVEPIERFVRAFGGKQVPFFEISKIDSKIVKTYRSLYSLVH